MRKRLTLARETLTPLTDGDLAAVAGAAVAATGGCPRTFRIWECLSQDSCDDAAAS